MPETPAPASAGSSSACRRQKRQRLLLETPAPASGTQHLKWGLTFCADLVAQVSIVLPFATMPDDEPRQMPPWNQAQEPNRQHGPIETLPVLSRFPMKLCTTIATSLGRRGGGAWMGPSGTLLAESRLHFWVLVFWHGSLCLG